MNLSQFNQLSQRERGILVAGAVIIVLLIIVFGIVAPYRTALEGLDRKIASRQRQLAEVQQLGNQYRQLQQQLTASERRLANGGDFSLLSFVEAASLRLVGRESLVSMRPQPAATVEGFREETVEVKLEKVRLHQLVQLLYAADTAPAPMLVKNLRIKTRFDDRNLLDVVVTFASYRRSS
ncbi:MAG: type II secretion system protein GspM [Syntrophotaleaceae bacterium]